MRYYRLAKFKMANPHVILRGMVFLGKNVEIHSTPDLSRLEIGRWVHIGDGNAIRCHEGSLRIGDKVVFGKDNVVNTYLDIEIGASTLVADWCYICDFDHRMDDINTPIKDQGIVKGPVRIGPDHVGGSEGHRAAKYPRRTRLCPRGARRRQRRHPGLQHSPVGLAREGGQEPQVRLGSRRCRSREVHRGARRHRAQEGRRRRCRRVVDVVAHFPQNQRLLSAPPPVCIGIGAESLRR